MGDHDKKPDVHQFDRWAADQQFKQEKSAMDSHQCAAPSLDKPGGGCQVSDFESHQLNDMVDMVKSANPEHLENAANGLWDARDAIWSAAGELLEHIGRVDWHGEAATAFHSWAGDLVNHSYELGFYADNVATQVSAASTGLASVRNSMPPRDNRPKILLPAEQAKLDPHGLQAQQVENHRQEAINQMNRLASYYAVSEGNLRGLDEPKFGKMPDMGVPTPTASHGWRQDDEGGGGQTPLPHTPVAGGPVGHSVVTPAGPSAVGSDSGTKLHHVVLPPEQHVHVDPPTQHVGTNIDNVNTLPPDTVKPTVPVAPPTAPGPGGGGGGPIAPFPTGPMVPPVGLPVPRGGTGGVRRPVGTSRMTVRPIEEPEVGTGAGRGPVSGVRQSVVPGQPGARGPASPVGRTPAGQSPMGKVPVGRGPVGRSIVGGTPRTGGVPGERIGESGPTGAARSGVIGGRPTTPSAKGVNGSRVPRGKVIGGEPAARDPHAVERPGQRGVIRAAEQEGAEGQASRRYVASGGAVGAPNGKAPTARNGARAAADEHMTGRSSSRRSKRDRDEKKSRRRQAPETE
nr:MULTISPECIES: hypothetical protein [Streptomyces]